MSTYIDFEEIKSTFPIETVAVWLGLELSKANNHQLRGACPSGEGDKRSLVITPSKGVFYSFAQQTGGDVIKLVEFTKNISSKEAAKWIVGNTVPTVPAEETPEAKPCVGFKPLDYLEAEHPAVEALGFDFEVAKKLSLGFAPRGILKGTVAIPVRLADGTLCGYVGITEAVLPPEWRGL